MVLRNNFIRDVHVPCHVRWGQWCFDGGFHVPALTKLYAKYHSLKPIMLFLLLIYLHCSNFCTSLQLQSFSCHWLLSRRPASFGHRSRYFLSWSPLSFSLGNYNADEPNGLGLEATSSFLQGCIKSWNIPADKPDSNYRKASQMPRILPHWAICYGKSLLTRFLGKWKNNFRDGAI